MFDFLDNYEPAFIFAPGFSVRNVRQDGIEPGYAPGACLGIYYRFMDTKEVKLGLVSAAFAREYTFGNGSSMYTPLLQGGGDMLLAARMEVRDETEVCAGIFYRVTDRKLSADVLMATGHFYLSYDDPDTSVIINTGTQLLFGKKFRLMDGFMRIEPGISLSGNLVEAGVKLNTAEISEHTVISAGLTHLFDSWDNPGHTGIFLEGEFNVLKDAVQMPVLQLDGGVSYSNEVFTEGLWGTKAGIKWRIANPMTGMGIMFRMNLYRNYSESLNIAPLKDETIGTVNMAVSFGGGGLPGLPDASGTTRNTGTPMGDMNAMFPGRKQAMQGDFTKYGMIIGAFATGLAGVEYGPADKYGYCEDVLFLTALGGLAGMALGKITFDTMDLFQWLPPEEAAGK